MHRPILTVALSIALAATGARAAQPVIYGPDGAPTVVQRKLYPMTGRWELGLNLTTAFNAALVDHYGAQLGLSHHPNEWFDWGAEIAANYTRVSGLADQVRATLPTGYRADQNTHAPNRGDEMANVAQMRLAGLGVARLAPFYGKFNLASEVRVHFQAYGLLGAGAGLFHHESVNICGSGGETACRPDQFLTSDAVRPTGAVGAGLRFYVNERFSLRAEMRAFLFPDTYRQGALLTTPSSGTDKTYLGVLTVFGAGISTVF
jgi:outer membrane beta-barrel protein